MHVLMVIVFLFQKIKLKTLKLRGSGKIVVNWARDLLAGNNVQLTHQEKNNRLSEMTFYLPSSHAKSSQNMTMNSLNSHFRRQKI